MKLRSLFFVLFAAGAVFAAEPKEKIAVTADNQAGLSESEVLALNNRIEAKLNDKYQVVTRSALNAILKETQFQNESGLVNDRGALARFGKISGVNLLLHYTVAKLGDKYTMSFTVLNCTTGELVPGKKTVEDAPTFRQLIARVDTALDKMGLLAGSTSSGVRKLAVLPVQIAGSSISEKDAKALETKLSAAILKSGSFEMLDRADLDKITKESKMVDFELADSGQSAKIARMSVADCILILKLTRLENNKITTNTAIAGTNTRIVSTVQVNFKMLDVKTARTLAADDFKYTMRSTEIPASEKRDWTDADYTNAVLDRASAALAGAILDQVDPVLVAGVNGAQVYLTRGSIGGIKAGDMFQVYVKNAPIVHPVTKKVLGQTEKQLGTLRVASVQPDMSIAAVVTGKATDFPAGALCRKLTQTAVQKQAPPAYPMAR